jgi:hypothetical protein
MFQYHYYIVICVEIVKQPFYSAPLSCHYNIFQNYHGTSLFYKNAFILAMTYLLKSIKLGTFTII